MSNNLIKIYCPFCKSEIHLEFWKLESTHKVLCQRCNRFFKLNISGDTPKKIINDIKNQLKKSLRGLK